MSYPRQHKSFDVNKHRQEILTISHESGQVGVWKIDDLEKQVFVGPKIIDEDYLETGIALPETRIQTSTDGETVSVSHQGNIEVFKRSRPEVVRLHMQDDTDIVEYCMTPCGKRAFTGSKDGMLDYWDLLGGVSYNWNSLLEQKTAIGRIQSARLEPSTVLVSLSSYRSFLKFKFNDNKTWEHAASINGRVGESYCVDAFGEKLFYLVENDERKLDLWAEDLSNSNSVWVIPPFLIGFSLRITRLS